MEALAPYDQFHSRGLEATQEIAQFMPARASDHLLDIGSGIGGPARYFAARFGCRITGIDLTPEFCEVARHLTRVMGLDDRVTFDTGNALHMPYPDATFDGAYSMNVSMNIADKDGFYREIVRVLKPGAWLILSEIATSGAGDPEFPTPWAASASASFLSTVDDTRRGLTAAGFDVHRLESTRTASLAYGARSREAVERGEKPLHRAVALVHGDLASTAAANSGRALADHRLDSIELLAFKRRAT
jgi:SAM-dependent methyltransferase